MVRHQPFTGQTRQHKIATTRSTRVADKTSIEWTDASWPVVTGCDHISAGCDNCLVPETRVLRADMTWVPIADIKAGDRLVSFTDKPAVGQNRVWEEATVQAVWETFKPTVTVELANGATFTASEDHLWLIAKRGASQWWRKTIGLSFKTEVRALQCTPTDTGLDDYRAGYVAGATEGDGTFRWDPAWRSSSMGFPQSYWRVAKPEQDVDVLDRLVEYLHHFGAEVAVRSFDQGESKFTDDPLPMAKVETRRRDHLALIADLCQERDSREWMAGWLAGMFDTDASYSGGSLRFCQMKPNDVLDKVERYGKELGFDLKAEHYEGSTCPTVRLMGGIAENIAFLGSIYPALTRRCRDFYGKRIETPTSPVVGIRRGPVRRLIDITTSTGTFVAEGALTHNCYAAKLTGGRLKHLPAYEGLAEKGRFNGKVRLLPDRLNWPLKWRKARKIFVSDMADLFHKDVPDDYIAQVFAVMSSAPQHSFQVLTKRHARMRSLLSSPEFRPQVARWAGNMSENGDLMHDQVMYGQWPLPNVWTGVSVEDQKWADIRIPALLETPAAVRFISAEPLLGPVDLSKWLVYGCPMCGRSGPWTDGRAVRHGDEVDEYWCQTCGAENALSSCAPPGLSWVIAGGESGPRARPMHPSWPRDLRDQCQNAGVAYLYKQWGEWHPQPVYATDDRHHVVMPDGRDRGTPWPGWRHDQPDAEVMERVGKKRAGRELDGRTWDEFPTAREEVFAR
jgi:protein gp37